MNSLDGRRVERYVFSVGRRMSVTAEFRFGAAHRLPRHEGACRNLHGHNYRVFVTVSGATNGETGMVVDFAHLRKVVWEKALSRVAHGDLNSILENPTAENFAAWIWDEIEAALPGVAEVRVDETDDASVVYRGE